AAGGTSVTITGTDFTGVSAVSFGGTAAASYTVDTPTQITAVSPAHAAGTVHITVTATGGTSTATAADEFTFVARPSVALTGGTTGSTNQATYTITATFSESVTGFTDTDVSTTNASVSNFSGSGAVYTFDVTASSEGFVSVQVPADAATDGANGNTASNTLAWVYDVTSPSVTLTGGTTGSTATATYTITATFSEPVTGFDQSDV